MKTSKAMTVTININDQYCDTDCPFLMLGEDSDVCVLFSCDIVQDVNSFIRFPECINTFGKEA